MWHCSWDSSKQGVKAGPDTAWSTKQCHTEENQPLLQLPGFTHRTGAQAVRLLVAGKFLADRIPPERPAQAVGDVAEMGDGDGAVADLDVRAGTATRPHGGQEVAHLVPARRALVQVDLVGADHLFISRGGSVFSRPPYFIPSRPVVPMIVTALSISTSGWPLRT